MVLLIQFNDSIKQNALSLIASIAVRLSAFFIAFVFFVSFCGLRFLPLLLSFISFYFSLSNKMVVFPNPIDNMSFCICALAFCSAVR